MLENLLLIKMKNQTRTWEESFSEERDCFGRVKIRSRSAEDDDFCADNGQIDTFFFHCNDMASCKSFKSINSSM